MPDISESDYRQFVAYTQLGTPQEIRQKIDGLEKDNKEQRDEIRGLKEKQPKDGQVIVTKDDAELLEQYKGLGAPDEVKNRLEQGAQAQVRVKDLETRAAVKAFVAAAGLAEEAVDTIIAIPDLKDAKFEVRTKKERNDKGVEVEVSTAYVTLAGDDQKAMSFTDAQGKVPALKGLRPATPTQQGGRQVKYAQVGGEGTGGQGESTYDRIRREAKERREKAQQQGAGAQKSIEERMGMAPA